MNEQITARDFLSAFYPDENETINLRTFGAKGASGIKPETYATTLNNLAEGFPKFRNEDSGVYFVVNSGGNKDQDINRYNAFFIENDELSMKEQHQALDNAPLQPSIRVETKKSVHAYWLIEDDCSEQDWRSVQVRLIDFFNGDKSIKNQSRCMRLTCTRRIIPKEWRESNKLKTGDSCNEKDIYGRANRRNFARL